MQTAKKKSIHLRVSRRLYVAVCQTSRSECRSPSSQVEFDLEVVLPVVQAERRFRLVPDAIDFGSPAYDLRTQLCPEYYEVLEETARNAGQSINQQANDLLGFVGERRIELTPRHVLLQKEEFRRRILEYVRARFARIQ